MNNMMTTAITIILKHSVASLTATDRARFTAAAERIIGEMSDGTTTYDMVQNLRALKKSRVGALAVEYCSTLPALPDEPSWEQSEEWHAQQIAELRAFVAGKAAA
jgi:hypothetical protein